jgi:hypothetical protein
MTSIIVQFQPSHPAGIDDEILALNLQLEELQLRKDVGKGKYKIGNVPDIEVAVSAFQTEIQNRIVFLNDLICAHSIARAVDTDSQTIVGMIEEEAQEIQDRHLAIQISAKDSNHDPLPPYMELGSQPRKVES